MASTPSASSLSAVLRCRGNIWTRNPPSKRPASPAHSLGRAGGIVRAGSHESAWEAFLHGERVVVWRGLTLTLHSPGLDVKEARNNDSRGINKLRHSNLSQPNGDARSAVPGAQNTPVRRLAHTLMSYLPGIETFSTIIRTSKYRTHEVHACKVLFVEEFPAAGLKVSIKSACLMENGGHMPYLVSSSWSALKSTCLSLTALVSELVFLKLTELCRSNSSPDAPQRLLSKLDEAKGQIHNPTELSSTRDSCTSGQKSTGDRPD